MRRSFKTLALTSLIGILSLAACSSPAAPATTAPATKVSIQLGWIYDFSTAPFYTAQKNGRFAGQNLDVDLQEGGFVNGKYVDAIEEVEAGKADFGLTSDFSVMQAQAQGHPLVAIAAMMQRSPVAIISLAKSNIRRPQDMIGHKIAVANGVATLQFNALLQAQNIDPTKLTIVPRTTNGVDPLLKGDVDALVGWTITEGIEVKQSGQASNVILLSDYGIESYEALLFTTAQMIKDKPEAVQKFLNATVQGINDVVANPDKAVDDVMAYGKDLNRNTQMISLEALLPLINPSGSKPGMMDDATWKFSYQIGVSQNALDKSLNLASVYNLNFLKTFYQ